jgi:catalase
MSDRGIPRSYRTMEGFGVHTFRLVDADGGTTLVKFHWKPRLGVHSLVWEEAQLLGGLDPDFHRRDLYDAIESGAFPQWDLGIQTFPDTPEQMFEGIDLLDSTKLVPEELAPVQVIGTLTLNGNPTNFFAESEQVAFHTGHLVPGIDGTDDPLLAARNFSYLDTQLTRLAGPNFNQIPINRPHAAVNDNHRDGFHQQAVHGGVAPYSPSSLDGGCPFFAGADEGAFVDVPVEVRGAKVRENPATYDDHFSQARLFWTSMTPVEQEHIVNAYAFELGKCYEQAIKERQLLALANIDADLCARVAQGLGLPAPDRTVDYDEPEPSPALSQVGETWPTDGRMIGVVVDPDGDLDGVAQLREALLAQGLLPVLIAPRGGELGKGLVAQRTFATARSVEYDALVVAGAAPPAPDAVVARDAKAGGSASVTSDPRVGLLVEECFRHSKAIAAFGDGRAVLDGLGVGGAGVTTADSGPDVLDDLMILVSAHRVWERFSTTV